MLVAFRFIAGSFGAAPVAIGGAVVGDLFEVKERGTAMSIYQAGQIISAVVGPPIGGTVGAYLEWRWVFWIVCMLVRSFRYRPLHNCGATNISSTRPALH